MPLVLAEKNNPTNFQSQMTPWVRVILYNWKKLPKKLWVSNDSEWSEVARNAKKCMTFYDHLCPCMTMGRVQDCQSGQSRSCLYILWRSIKDLWRYWRILMGKLVWRTYKVQEQNSYKDEWWSFITQKNYRKVLGSQMTQNGLKWLKMEELFVSIFFLSQRMRVVNHTWKKLPKNCWV